MDDIDDYDDIMQEALSPMEDLYEDFADWGIDGSEFRGRTSWDHLMQDSI